MILNERVPMVCLPIAYDQPSVAYRVSDELGFGIRLIPQQVNSDEIKVAIKKVLLDSSYQERITRFSQISRRYNGSLNAAKIVDDFVNNFLKKKN
jgi:UDP:flavonoid glycosyltransferase YjiC (YdhE family)